MTKEEKALKKQEKKELKKAEKERKKQAKLEAKANKAKKNQTAAPKATEVTPEPKAEEVKAPETTPEVTEEPKTEAKNATKTEAQPAQKAAPSNKVYHVSLRKEDGKWQVKFANGEKALKLFDTQKEAIAFAKEKANNQDGSISIHKVDGKIRKQKY